MDAARKTSPIASQAALELGNPATPHWQYEILVDGECPLCAKEASLLRKLDHGRLRLRITDITHPDFDPADYDTTYEQVMGTIHGRAPDGTIHTGVEVFRRSYAAVGWGWLLAWTRLPILRTISDAVYRFFARHRLSLTGRRNACPTGRCRV